MKKLIAVLLVITMVVGLTACGFNRSLIDTEWGYNYAYVSWSDGQEKIAIDSWSEDETTFTLHCEDGRVICTSQVNVILVKEQESEPIALFSFLRRWRAHGPGAPSLRYNRGVQKNVQKTCKKVLTRAS